MFTSKSLLIASGVSALALGLTARGAGAQPVDQSGSTDVAPTPPPGPPQPPPVAVQPAPPPEREMSIHDLDVDRERPEGLAFAIGLGYERIPGGTIDLETPNIASVRVRFANGITLEPTVTIANTSKTTDPGTGTTSTDSLTEFGVGALGRFPVIRRGKFDFEVLGSVGFDVSKDDPDGDNNTTTVTTFTLGWGIGIGYWLSHHWQLSASATNPLVEWTKTSTDTGPTTSMSTSSTSFGITFDPTIAFMIHLYN